MSTLTYSENKYETVSQLNVAEVNGENEPTFTTPTFNVYEFTTSCNIMSFGQDKWYDVTLDMSPVTARQYDFFALKSGYSNLRFSNLTLKSITITYEDNSVQTINGNWTGGENDTYGTRIDNPSKDKKVKKVSGILNLYCAMSTYTTYSPAAKINMCKGIRANSLSGEIVKKLSKNLYFGSVVSDVKLNYVATIAYGTAGTIKLYTSQDGVTWTLKNSLIAAATSQVSTGAIDATKDTYLKAEWTNTTTDYMKIVFQDITITSDFDLSNYIHNSVITNDYMAKVDIATNYISLSTVTDNYVPKSIVERDYRKVFFVNNAVATKGSFEDRIKLTWFTTDTAIKYNIYRKNPLGDFVKIGEVNDGKNTYYDMTAVKGTHYFYKISAVNSNSAESELTSEIEGYCNDIINSVKDVEATSGIYEDKVIVTWRNDPLADSYTVYRKKAAESGAQKVELGVVPKNTIMFEDTTVPSNEIYFYYVKSTSLTLGDSPECHPDTGYRGIAKAGYRLGRFVVGDSKNNLIYDLGFKS